MIFKSALFHYNFWVTLNYLGLSETDDLFCDTDTEIQIIVYMSIIDEYFGVNYLGHTNMN